MRQHVERYWKQLADLVQSIPRDQVTAVADLLLERHLAGGRIFLAGNGGSAATASHLTTDLGKGTRTDGVPPFRVICLNDNQSLMTAIGNDLGYERVFAEQVEALVEPDDAVVLISCSGTSPNVVLAARAARRTGATVLALTGASGGQLHRLAQQSVRVPSDVVEQIEDAHLMIAHSVCVALRARLGELAGVGAGGHGVLAQAVDALLVVPDGRGKGNGKSL